VAGLTKKQLAIKQREADVWLALHQIRKVRVTVDGKAISEPVLTISEIARQVGKSRAHVHYHVTRAMWRSLRSPGRQDYLRRKMSLALYGSSIEIQTKICGHLGLKGIECLVCDHGEMDDQIGHLASPKVAKLVAEKPATIPKKPPKFVPRGLRKEMRLSRRKSIESESSDCSVKD
jgi:hypothetical protein